MPHKTTITGESHANTMIALRESIKEMRRGKLTAGVLLLHSNAPVHVSRQTAIRECGLQQLNHPPYTPDLAPSDYFLFRVLMKSLRGQQFSNDKDVMGLKSLQEKWMKCMKMLGDYTEK
uniref:Tc1-like transposase DDE domain-containing protein n=1 Tax=Paramormyrops kingsleyae TaxID=1676925 RepID=A0A3B3QZ08_9TELE